jgi:predicted enzyme related to lactoylglutathione lyase
LSLAFHKYYLIQSHVHREIDMGRPVVHWELMSKDPAKVAAFYEKIVGWKIQHIPEMNYRLVETGGEGGINGGILKPERAGPWPGNMTLYIDVDDLAAYRKRIVAEGGKSMSGSRRCPVWVRSRSSPIQRAV